MWQARGRISALAVLRLFCRKPQLALLLAGRLVNGFYGFQGLVPRILFHIPRFYYSFNLCNPGDDL